MLSPVQSDLLAIRNEWLFALHFYRYCVYVKCHGIHRILGSIEVHCLVLLSPLWMVSTNGMSTVVYPW